MARRIAPDVAVRCIDLSVARQSAHHRVVDGASFTLPYGRALAIMGATGAGKTSLVAVLAGADAGSLEVVGGTAQVEGVTVRRSGRAHRELSVRTGYVPQNAGAFLSPRLTVAETITEPITSRDRRAGQRALAIRVASLLDELRLPLGAAAQYPYELSAGMRQRVAIARALVLDPRVFIGDEPYANLDVDVRRAARDALLRRRDESGMSILVVTNDAATVTELDADVLVLQGGCTVAYGHGTSGLLWTPGEGARAAS